MDIEFEKSPATDDLKAGQDDLFDVHMADEDQVWSLTQFYSIDFSKSRIDVNKCVFYKRTIKVCGSCS